MMLICFINGEVPDGLRLRILRRFRHLRETLQSQGAQGFDKPFSPACSRDRGRAEVALPWCMNGWSAGPV
jgi:hypothetical protein